MKKNKNNIMLKYFLLSVLMTTNLIFFKTTNNLLSNKYHLNKRILNEKDTSEYVCTNAGLKLKEKYEGDFNEEVLESKKELTEAQKSIIKFARKTDFDKIKPYLKRIWLFITFLILDIIFIFLFISLCICHCSKKCLFKQTELSKKGRLISFIITTLFDLMVIVLSVLVMMNISPFFERINGLACSAMTFLNHVNKGLYPSYPDYSQHWVGLINIIEKFKNNKIKFDSINYTDVETKFNIVNEEYNKSIIEDPECLSNFSNYEQDKEIFYEFMDSSFANFDFSEEIKDLEESVKVIDDTWGDIENQIYDSLHGYINSHIKNSCIAIFALTLIACLLGFISAILYYFLKHNIYRTIYIFIWYFSAFLMILVIIVGIIFGLLGYLLTDGFQVCYYILSIDNLNNPDPLVFITNKEFIAGIIDNCANGDGDFLDIIQEGLLILSVFEKFIFEFTLFELTQVTCSINARDAMIDYYQAMLDAMDQAYNISSDLVDIKCTFVKNDKNIILNEIYLGGNKGLLLSTFQLLVGLFLGISIFSGIIFVHKYKISNQSKDNNKIVNINNNNKSININRTIDNLVHDNKNSETNINMSDNNINNNIKDNK